MTNTTLRVHGIKETESYMMHDVKITEQVPSLSTSLPNTLSNQDPDNFHHITYLLLENHQYDMLIGLDNIRLIMQRD